MRADYRPVSIQKLLVANRGEIAVRVFRTCRELGIGTVAVVAPDDAGSLHARSADERVEIASYLHSEEHIRAAKESGADAIHPGYGFLAENADFAAAVEAAGLTWVGPPSESLRLGGDKLAAKRIAREAGVPVLPDGTPEEIGFPLLVKAAAGGGGRGMRVVRSAAELDDALEAAEREAEGAFGDGTLYCERYLERPRHVEVQLLADAHGSGRRGRRARLLRPAAPPEGPRGGACAGPLPRAAHGAPRGCRGVRPRDRLSQRRHGRVRARRRRLLLPRAERPHPGRAPGHRGRHRPRPRRRAAPHRSRRAPCNRLVTRQRATRSRFGSMPRIPGRFSLRPAVIERLELPSDSLLQGLDSRGRRRRGRRRGRARATTR